MSHEHAKTIMENGGKWGAGMLDSDGRRIYMSSHGPMVQWDWVEDEPANTPENHAIPDLTDGPTCRALQSQVVARIVERFPGVRVLITFSHSSDGVYAEWHVQRGSFTRPLFMFDGPEPEPEALAAAFVWLAGVK